MNVSNETSLKRRSIGQHILLSIMRTKVIFVLIR